MNLTATIQQYHNSYRLSQYYLDLLQVNYFPLDLDKVIEKINRISEFTVLVATQQEYMDYRKLHSEKGKVISIKDGRTYYIESQKLYFIVYNDSKPIKRIRFTIAHELGHIILGHLEDEVTEINRGGISNELYQELENQADVFAGNFLVPPILLNERLKMINSRSTPYLISETFQVSEPAVHNRYKDFDIWKSQSFIPQEEMNIFYRCKDSVCFVICQVCGAETIISHPETFLKEKTFCKFCGCNSFNYIRRKVQVKYVGVKMDDALKALICPACENEQIISDGDYCKICGTKLVNECSETYSGESDSYIAPCEKGKRLDGNARFCPYCGNPSSFLQNGILRPIIKNNKLYSALTEIQEDSVSEIPF